MTTLGHTPPVGAAPPRPTLALTPEQRAAVDHPLTPLLLVAGAGTGKTTVMAERILRLVQQGEVRDDQVLALTFTNKAAAHLKVKVRERLPGADVTVATYHGFAAGLVDAHRLEAGLEAGARVLNRAQAWQLLFAVFDDFRFERRKVAARPGLVVDHALDLAARCADHLVPVERVRADSEEVAREARWQPTRDAAAARAELGQVVAAYERRKRERNLLDYGDQLVLAVRLLREHPELARAHREQWPVVLLDEYQDTNYAQRVLLQLLYPEGSAVTAVGDDLQSIYAFRGAHLRNVLDFPDHFPPAQQLPLQVSFRAGPELVTLANRIQAEVGEALRKALVARPDAPPSTVECFLAADEAEEAVEIARDVAERGRPWAGHAVLCRKRRLIPAVVAALEAQSVPVEVVGTSGLLQRPEVVDLVAWLEVLHDLGAGVALVRLLEGPRYRIGFRDLAALARHARRLAEVQLAAEAEGDADGAPDDDLRFGLADALADLEAVPDLSDEARRRLAAFGRERAALATAAARLPVVDLAETIIRRTGLWGAAGERGRENLLRFLDLAQQFAPVDGDPGLPAFLEYLHLLDETDEDLAEAHPTDVDAVKVMTIHQAKGLEFPVVYVPGLAGTRGSSRLFPDNRAGENALSNAAALPWWVRDEDEGMPSWRTARTKGEVDDLVRQRKLDEEWRLFYVACTRAQRHLVCSAAQWYPGTAQPQGPSLFYEFVAGQTDLVKERFRRDPPDTDPAQVARERLLDEVASSASAVAATEVAPAGGGDEEGQLSFAAVLEADAAPAPTGEPVVGPRRAPTALSVTGLVTYARCPKQFYWSVVRPLPRRASGAARLGTEIHRWIELRAGRQLTLVAPSDEADEADLDPDALPRDADARAGLRASFLASPYADLDPTRVEAPFRLTVDLHVVRGRVDAVYERDGRVELVDFKTGHRPEEGDAGSDVQLQLYALGAVDTWRVPPERIRTTYCWLRADGPPELESTDWDGAAVEQVRAGLATALDRLAGAHYDPTPGRWCEHCDFLAACAAGRAWTGAGGTTAPTGEDGGR